MKNFLLSFCWGLMGCGMLPSLAPAAIIAPGGTVGVSGTTVALRPELAGLILQDTIVNWSDGPGTTFGTLQTRVVREDSTGTLDFYERIFNDPSSRNFVSAGRFEDYTGFTTDVDFRLDGLGDLGPDQVKRVGAGGTSVNFVFNEVGVGPGQSSLFLLTKTEALNYTTSQGDLIIGRDATGAPSGDLSNLFPVYSPSGVPEPGTYAMISAGLVLLGIRRRASYRG